MGPTIIINDPNLGVSVYDRAMNPNRTSSPVFLLRRAVQALLCGLIPAAFACLPTRAAPTADPPNRDIAGVYTLVAVNGLKVPMTLEHEGAKLVIRSGAFTINADGTCSSKMVFVPPSGQEIARVVKATYTRQGTTLSMQWEGAGTTNGTVEGDMFTMNNEGMVLTYRR